MSSVAIRVEGLGKQYHVGAAQKRYDRLGDQLTDMLRAPLRRTAKLLRGQATGAAELDETIWALEELSFEIQAGEIVGVLGRNGAGKSTLLKILSRITEPTCGYADIFGRVGSLLEVGTGFHPELTGRENVYLNGAILGMRRREIDSKFDEIVAFAEIERFLDTPVKHYSSGMYVRLAFAVAAHLEPEILLVDEVLAVGDVAFQRKCLGKMGDVAQQGRTVLFVSHNMGLMQTLCQRGILLQAGRVRADGVIGDVVDIYLQQLVQAGSQELAIRTDRRGPGASRSVRVEVSDGSDTPSTILRSGGPARFAIHVSRLIPGISCNILIVDAGGQPVMNFQSRVRSPVDSHDPTIGPAFLCEVDELLLRPGHYRMDVAIIGDNVLQDFVEAAATFDVGEGYINGRPVQPHRRVRISVPHRWTLPTPDARVL